MRLKHITFTGIDGRTDLDALWLLQRQYPIAEFGVLVAKNWRDNGNRYFNPSHLKLLEGLDFKLSAHLCGSIARAAVCGDVGPFLEWARGFGFLFNRCQLNIATSATNPDEFRYEGDIADYFDEVILQQRSDHDCPLWALSPASDSVTVLLDASGGQGIDTPIEVLPVPHKVGYAGGINPDNVADKLAFLLQHPDVGDFWIDMESGVRTGDWFDIDKVRRVLEICREVTRDLHVEE